MKILAIAALAALGSVSSQAGIYGVKLVSAVQNAATTGAGVVSSNVGVEEGGLNAQQSYNLTKTSGTFSGGMGDSSSASDYWSLSIDVFWLQQNTSDTPPSNLYLTKTSAGSGTTAANSQGIGIPGNAFATGSANASAGSLTVPTSTATTGGNNSMTVTNAGQSYTSTSTSVSVTWTFVAYVNGMPLYKTTTPVGFSTPTVSTSGTSYAQGNTGTSVHVWGQSGASLGVSHRFFVSI